MELVLASASPRRAQLLAQMALSFTVRPAQIDETRRPAEAPAAYVERLASAKAQAVALPGELTLGADTVVVLGERVFGKPVDADEAVAMLLALGGGTHEVLTAVALTDGERMRAACVQTSVTFVPVTDAAALAYWRTGEPADKAGGYGIQGIGGIFVQSITGSYSAVVGLPLAETEQLLREFGVDTWRARSHV